MYTTTDVESKLILDIALFGRRVTDPVVTFLHKLKPKSDLSNAEFLVDQFGYQTAFAHFGLSGQVNYTGRNTIDKWFHSLKMRIN